MKIEKPEIFKGWLTSILGEMCDADPEALGKYILALIKKEKKERLERTLKEKLNDFLLDATGKFVGLVLEKVHVVNPNVSAVELSSSADVPPSASSQSSKRILEISETDSFNPKKRQRCDLSPHGDANSRYETFTAGDMCVKKEIGDLHPPSSLLQKANIHMDSKCYLANSKQSIQCKDYYEKGYCLSGNFCGFQHGTDPILVNDFPRQLLTNLKSSNMDKELTSNEFEGAKSTMFMPPLPTSSPPKIPPPPPLSPPFFTNVLRDNNENKVDGNGTCLQNSRTALTESKKISRHAESNFKTKKKFDHSRLGTPRSSLRITEIQLRLNTEKIANAYKTLITSHRIKLRQAKIQLVKNAIHHRRLILVKLMKGEKKKESVFLKKALDIVTKQIKDLIKDLKIDNKDLKCLFLKENTPKMADSKIAVETQPVEVDDDEEEEDEEENREARSWRH